MSRHLRFAIPMILGIAGAGPAADPATGGAPVAARFGFERRVGNAEYAVTAMSAEHPRGLRLPAAASGDLWFGSIMRRIPGETIHDSAHYVPILAEYVDGRPRRAWYDADLDADLSDEAPARLWAYPAAPGARAFLATLRWTVRQGDDAIPVDWTVRVVLEPVAGPDRGPMHRCQMVQVMEGALTLEGRAHRAFLFDGNGDGIYSRDPLDGVYVDVDDDGHVLVDEISPEYGPFSAPFQMGARIYDIETIDPRGREIGLRVLGTAEPLPAPEPGRHAPSFSFSDLTGTEVRLADHRGRYVIVFFHASWCGAAARHAAALKAIDDRYRPAGLAILGVSFDAHRSALEAFRREHGLTWPTFFSGHYPWEDPIGRAYQVKTASAAYLIDPEGRLEGLYYDMETLAARLARLLPFAGSGAGAGSAPRR